MNTELTTWYWRQACETLDTMQMALVRGNYNNVVTMGYQAMEQGAKALLAANDTDAGSHRAVQILVSRELVKTGKIGPEYSKVLRPAYRQRTTATYSAGELTQPHEAEEYANQAHDYLTNARKLLLKWGMSDEKLAQVPGRPGTGPLLAGGDPGVKAPGGRKTAAQAHAKAQEQPGKDRRQVPGSRQGGKR